MLIIPKINRMHFLFTFRHFAHCLRWWINVTQPVHVGIHSIWQACTKWQMNLWRQKQDFFPFLCESWYAQKSLFMITFSIVFHAIHDPLRTGLWTLFRPWPTSWDVLASRNHICNFPHRGYETRWKERMCRGCWFDSKYYCVDTVFCSNDKADFAHHCFCITSQTEFSIIPGLSLFVTGE